MAIDVLQQKLTIPAQLDHLHKLGASLQMLFEQEYALLPTAQPVYSLELSVQEIATNIVRHAYAESEGDIEFEITLNKNDACVTVTLLDTGESFDPDCVDAPALGTLQVHGYGLFLVRQLMDKVDYHTSTCGNQWVLYKDLSSITHDPSIVISCDIPHKHS